MTKRFFLSIVFAAVASAQMPQGQQQSVAGVVKLNRAPVSNEVLKVKLPRPVESQRVPTITLRMNMPSGDLRDPASLPGVSDATAALIRLGTKTRSSRAAP